MTWLVWNGVDVIGGNEGFVWHITRERGAETEEEVFNIWNLFVSANLKFPDDDHSNKWVSSKIAIFAHMTFKFKYRVSLVIQRSISYWT